MKPFLILPILLSAGTFGLGAGRWLAVKSAAGTNATAAVPGIRHSHSDPVNPPSVRANDVIAAVALAAKTGGLRETIQAEEVFARLDDSHLEAAFEELMASGGDLEAPAQLIASLFRRWAKRDPEAALAASSRLRRRDLRREAAETSAGVWAEKAPSKAFDTALGLKGELGGRSAWAAIRVWAGSNPAAALEKLRAAGNIDFGRNMEYSVFETWLKKDPAAAVEQVKAIMIERATVKVGDGGSIGAAEAWAKADPAAALAFAAAQPADASAHSTMVGGILGEWMRQDASAATAAFLKLPEANQTADACEAAGLALGRNGQPDETRERIANEMMAALPAGPRREAFTRGQVIALQFSGSFQEAAEMASTLPAEGGQQGSLADTIRAWTAADTEGASTWTAAQPEGPMRDQAAAQLSRVVVQIDPSAALQWAGSIGSPGLKNQTYEVVIRDWLQRDQASARRWLAETADISMELKSALEKR